MMPEGDGKEFLTRLLDSREDIPVIINTAYSHYKNDFICWAADAYVIKSSDLTELKSEIDSALSRRPALV
jgi:DNA-binding response OmpR family regulator